MAFRETGHSAYTHALRESDVIILSTFAIISVSIMAALTRTPLMIGALTIGGFWLAAIVFLRLSRALRSSATPVETAENEFMSGTRFAATFTDALPQAVAVLDRDGRVIHANPMAQDLIDIDSLGRPLSVYVRDSGITDRLSTALAGYTPDPLMIHQEIPTERYVSLLFSSVTHVGDGSGRSFVLVVMNDVTELILGGQRRADFLANASHELKTPIASMLGYIETLRGHAKDDPEAQERFLGIMAQQAERMQRLIQDLLSLRRIEQDEHIAPTETADLDLSIRAAIESVAPLAESRNITLKYKKKKKSIVPGHQDETIQLCLNLIENATKLSPPGETVYITLSYFEQWTPNVPFADGHLPETATTRVINPAPTSPLPLYTITISDSGPGFSRTHLPRIGERFYRVAGDLSSKEKGTGLGLAIVKHIARRHRAGLYVRSKEGLGTEFCLIYQEKKPSETADTPKQAAPSEKNMTVQ